MDAVTYPHPDVKVELSSWLQRRADVVEERELTSAFGVEAIPTAVLLDPDLKISDHVLAQPNPRRYAARQIQRAKEICNG